MCRNSVLAASPEAANRHRIRPNKVDARQVSPVEAISRGQVSKGAVPTPGSSVNSHFPVICAQDQNLIETKAKSYQSRTSRWGLLPPKGFRLLCSMAPRQIEAWQTDPGMRPTETEANAGRADATGRTPCDNENDLAFAIKLGLSTGEQQVPSDAQVLAALETQRSSVIDALFNSSSPLPTHPVVRCIRPDLGESRDDLRLKVDVEDLSGASGRLLSWTSWASTMPWSLPRLGATDVVAWAQQSLA